MGGVPLQFASGSTAFVAALARAVRGPVLTGKVVASISTGASGTGETASAPSVSVRCVDGSSYRADFAVSTLPIPALGDVAFDPPLTAPQADALKEVASTPITVVYLAVRRDFWESDGWPVSMWTDSPVERVFPIRDAEGKAASIVTFVDGPAAARLDAMGEPERLRFVERELARIRPSTKGAVEGVRSVSWAKDRFAGGAYPFYAPGQVARHRAQLQAPAGLLHFAGEHTAVTQPGMEGACESADRAVAEIVSRATGLPRPASPSAPPKPA
jgi:monoamine oxidase